MNKLIELQNLLNDKKISEPVRFVRVSRLIRDSKESSELFKTLNMCLNEWDLGALKNLSWEHWEDIAGLGLILIGAIAQTNNLNYKTTSIYAEIMAKVKAHTFVN